MIRTIPDWIAHWNGKAPAEDPIAQNGYCLGGVAIDAERYRAAILEPWLELLELEPHFAVLDVGCGSGLLLRELEPRVGRAVGVDFSAAQLSRYEGGAETHVCAAHELPFTGEQFDRILVASVVHYFPSLQYFDDVVQRLVALLRAGGRLLIADVPIGAQPPDTAYLWYDPLELIGILERLDMRFSIEAQSRPKREINHRYDIVVSRD